METSSPGTTLSFSNQSVERGAALKGLVRVCSCAGFGPGVSAPTCVLPFPRLLHLIGSGDVSQMDRKLYLPSYHQHASASLANE